jgi:hypothetical protein
MTTPATADDAPIRRWDQGRATIEALLAEGRLTRVDASRTLAQSYIATARQRLKAAETIRQIDPAGGFGLTYDAARLALGAVLINQGLRPRGDGAHAVLLEAILAQLEPPRQKELREFSWMRRLRNDTQYPDSARPTASLDDLDQALPAARHIVDRAATLVEHMPPF